MNTIAITGASGFIGKHLVAALLQRDNVRIKLLARSRHGFPDELAGPAVEIVQGDLREPGGLRGFLEQGCSVVNLAYLRDAGEAENLAAQAHLLNACKSAQVRRLLHCSTADVAGRVTDNPVTENTVCRPVTEYAATKLRIENAVLAAAKDHFDAVILRPTAVFGPEGENLAKLAGSLNAKKRLPNYLKSRLFGKRRMNLVTVANVVAALMFLLNHSGNFNGEVFIVSDDDNPRNNFADVESFLMREFGIPEYSLARLPIPSGVLALLLAVLGRNSINPACNYSSDKLLGLGFERADSFETGLAEYAAWYRSLSIDRQKSVAV